jgi:protein-tyrosine kinase
MSRIHDALRQAQREIHPEADRDDATLDILNEVPLPPDGNENEALASAEPVVEHPTERLLPTDRQFNVTLQPAVVAPKNGREAAAAAPAVAGVHPWRPDPAHLLFLHTDANGTPRIGTEQLRTLRSKLYQLRSSAPLKTVLISSAMPSEGKSFMAANLAHAFVQQSGRTCVVVDGDLRRATLHQYFGAAATPGLSEYLRGQASFEQIVQVGPFPGLSLIPAGAITNDAAELLASSRLRQLIQGCAGRYDWVVIDSPPALAVSDASRISELCDGVLLVVRSGQTPYEAARKARGEFRAGAVLGMVLNDSPVNSSSYAQYYYSGYNGQGKK